MRSKRDDRKVAENFPFFPGLFVTVFGCLQVDEGVGWVCMPSDFPYLGCFSGKSPVNTETNLAPEKQCQFNIPFGHLQPQILGARISFHIHTHDDDHIWPTYSFTVDLGLRPCSLRCVRYCIHKVNFMNFSRGYRKRRRGIIYDRKGR